VSDALAIGSSGILAYQYALTTTSNNIANAAVEGYSRQEAELRSVMPRQIGVDYIGSGIYTDGVRRQYDTFVESNLQRSISELRGQEPLVSYANRAFDLLSSPQVGLTKAFDAFFASVRALAAEPGSLIARGGFLREADGLAAGFRQLSGQWALLEEESAVAATSATTEINSLSVQLATINKQLSRRTTVESQPPELLDQRDKLLRRLSELAGIRTAIGTNGEVKVSLNASLNADEGGAIIVDGVRSTTLQTTFDAQEGRAIVLMNPFSVEARAVNGLSGGQLGGVIGFREQVLLPGRARLNDLAMTVTREVNAIHREGVDGRGLRGKDLFTFDPVTGAAASLSLAVTDPQSVASAGPLRVIPGAANVTGRDATVTFVAPRPGQPAALPVVFDPAQGQPSRQALIQLEAYDGIASIPPGLRDVAVQFDLEAGQWPQLLTRDGRHLLGSPLTGTQRAQLMEYGGFSAGATYSDAYLNPASSAQAYLAASYFLGARALPSSAPIYDVKGTDAHQLLGYQPVAARLQGQPLASTTTIDIAAGALVLNGQALSAYAGPATVEDLAAWLNGQSSLTGTTASVVYPQSSDSGSVSEAPTLLLTATEATTPLMLGIGANGSPTDLGKLGFSTGLYWQGEVPEDLIVMATSTADGPTDLRVSVAYAGQEHDRLEALRARRFEVDFDTATHYRITDAATGTVLAERSYDPLAATIEFQGLVVSLPSAPSAGDRYRIDGNQDGIGDNSNLLPLAALEARKLEDGYSMGEAYTALSGRIGTVAWQAGLAQEALEVVNMQAIQARDAVSGVSLDEEAANLIRFQQAYQASAKVMQVATDLFDTLIRIG
jgi:flagellar hook-associated protein 1 FlgK